MVFEAFLSHNYPLFMTNYLQWIQSKSIPEKAFDLFAVNE